VYRVCKSLNRKIVSNDVRKSADSAPRVPIRVARDKIGRPDWCPWPQPRYGCKPLNMRQNSS
jgi:hypothetical protein